MHTARSVALGALHAIDTRGAFTALALDQALGRHPLPGRDRALATELVYGTVRRLNTLDWALNQVARRPVAELDPWVRAVLRQGAYQLIYLDRVPPRAAVHEAVELARRRAGPGAARFVNGVLRGLQRLLPLAYPDRSQDLTQHLTLVHSIPEWLVERWVAQLGESEAEALLAALNRSRGVSVRVNRLRADREQAQAALAALGVTAEPTRFSPDGLVLGGVAAEASLGRLGPFNDGWITPQDEAAMLVAPIVDPAPGQFVIDVAAAPGGKTTHLAERMGDRGRVVAMDIHAHKLRLVEAACRRLGLTSVETVVADARTAGERYGGQADAVLVDAPCSGLGTLAHRPDARWQKRAADIADLARIQSELLAAAARAVRPGGTLVYSTCTTEPAENQGVIEAFLAVEPAFALQDLRPWLPEALAGAATACTGCLQLWPHRHGTDGFFIARLQRIAAP